MSRFKDVLDELRKYEDQGLEIMDYYDHADVTDAGVDLTRGLSVQVDLEGYVYLNQWDDEDESLVLVKEYGPKTPAKVVAAHVTLVHRGSV